MPLATKSLASALCYADALRGRRQGWAATPAPPARDAAPGNPNSMPSYLKRLACMPLGRGEQEAMIQVSALQRHVLVHRSRGKHSLQGVWGPLARPAGGAAGTL